jgi:hypothetical protein
LMSARKRHRIVKFLDEVKYPIDVEKIRRACKIGNWNTALNYGLSLLVEGRIKGQKTSRGWVFWTRQETQLNPWEEAIGVYKALQITKGRATLKLTQTPKEKSISFPKDSPEAEILIDALSHIPKGTKLALLRTDSPNKPIIIRILGETE